MSSAQGDNLVSSSKNRREEELNSLRERGVTKSQRGKYGNSSSFLSPEEAEAFLASQRLKRKTKDAPAPPKNLSAADLNGWYSQQKQRDLEERRKREEAEAFLRGYRADFDSFASSSAKEPNYKDTPTNSYPLRSSITSEPDAKSHQYSLTSATNNENSKNCDREADNAAASALLATEVQYYSHKTDENVDNAETVVKKLDDEAEGTTQVESVENENIEAIEKELQDKSGETIDNLSGNVEQVSETVTEVEEKAKNELAENVAEENVTDENVSDIKEKVDTEVNEENDVTTSDELAENATGEVVKGIEEKVDTEANAVNEKNEITTSDELAENATDAIVKGIKEKVDTEANEEKDVENVTEEIATGMEERVDTVVDEEKNIAGTKDLDENVVDEWSNWICEDEGAKFQPEDDRYHLYVSGACPLSHSVILVRKLKGLEDSIGMTSLSATWQISSDEDSSGEYGWVFASEEITMNSLLEGKSPYWGEADPLFGFHSLKEIYEAAGDTIGKYTLPLLWDKKEKTIVSNKPFDIMRMMNNAFNMSCSVPELDLYPEHIHKEIDAVNDWIYHSFDLGVTRCGFAETQAEYDAAIDDLTESFDRIDFILRRKRFISGPFFTEADIRLFATLLRFDEVYYVYFKTNTRRVSSCESILSYMREIYQMDDIAETCDMDLIKTHYYTSYVELNRHCIIPKGSGFLALLQEPHNRDEFPYLS